MTEISLEMQIALLEARLRIAEKVIAEAREIDLNYRWEHLQEWDDHRGTESWDDAMKSETVAIMEEWYEEMKRRSAIEMERLIAKRILGNGR